MLLIGVFYTETDGCTYSCDVFIGVFSYQENADEGIKKDMAKYQVRKREDYSFRDVLVDELYEG